MVKFTQSQDKSYMNIFIVGPMGSGKSTVGKIISSELFLNFFDTDEEIESRTGASIDWIFDLEGEEGFRKRESQILEEMVQQNSIVLSTGDFPDPIGPTINIFIYDLSYDYVNFTIELYKIVFLIIKDVI